MCEQLIKSKMLRYDNKNETQSNEATRLNYIR